MATALFHVDARAADPIWRQLVVQVRALRIAGRLPPGAMLPSVRELAGILAVNPMTVSRAWSQLEADGVVELVRGQGMRVLAAESRARSARLDELDPLLAQVARRARQLDLDHDAVASRLRRHLEEQP